jgi:hypothetical protein
MVHEPRPHRLLQAISFLPDREFRRCVERYQGDLRLRGFSCWDQYLAMAFAQMTYRESLRDIEAYVFDAGQARFRGKVARSTLAEIPRFSLTSSDSVVRVTPRAAAARVMVKPKGSIHWRSTKHQGAGGSSSAWFSLHQW